MYLEGWAGSCVARWGGVGPSCPEHSQIQNWGPARWSKLGTLRLESPGTNKTALSPACPCRVLSTLGQTLAVMDETGTCGESRREWPWPGAFPTSPFGLYFLWGLEVQE